MADADLRQRKAAPSEQQSTSESSRAESKATKHNDDESPWLDVLRVLTFLVVASCGLSYVISGGESYFWGVKHMPNYLRVDYWKSQFVRLLPCVLSKTCWIPAIPPRHAQC
jgi:hypothetical protein